MRLPESLLLSGVRVASLCFPRCSDIMTIVRPGPRDNCPCTVAWDFVSGIRLWFGKGVLKHLV